MTIWDGHGRTPHDTLDEIQASIAMILCLPCLCVVACSKIRLPSFKRKRRTDEEPANDQKKAESEESAEKLYITSKVAEG